MQHIDTETNTHTVNGYNQLIVVLVPSFNFAELGKQWSQWKSSIVMSSTITPSLQPKQKRRSLPMRGEKKPKHWQQ
jgi:hypothetical protein